MKKIKVLHIGNHSAPCVGGIETVILSAAKAQASLGVETAVLVFDTDSKGEMRLPAQETIEGVPFFRVRQRGPAYYRIPSSFREVLRIMGDFDVIHVHGLGGWLDTVCVLKPFHGKPIVANTHGGFFHTSNRRVLKRVYSMIILPLVKRATDFFCADSESDLKVILPLARAKYAVIPNGVDISRLLAVPAAKKKNNHFLFVGRLSKNKRVDALIRAFAHVVKNSPGAKLSIVGEDWENLIHAHRALASELKLSKNVDFHGKISEKELHALYTRAGVCVSASEYEGFGLTIIEGMAAGCIPCVNAIPTFTAFASEHRGFVTDFSNPEKAGKDLLAAAMLSKKEFSSMQARARDYSKTYSIEHVEMEHAALYKRLLARKQ